MPCQGQMNHLIIAMRRCKGRQHKSAGDQRPRRICHSRAKFGHTWRGIVKRGGLMSDARRQCCGETTICHVVKRKLTLVSTKSFQKGCFGGKLSLVIQAIHDNMKLFIHHRETNTSKSIKLLKWLQERQSYLVRCAERVITSESARQYESKVECAVSSFRHCLRMQHLCAQRDANSHSFQSHRAHGA